MGGRDGKIRLLIVRHGETDCNVQGIIQGQLDTDLNAVGRKQAEYVGKALSKETIDEVYTSPLRRAKDTADAIVRHHPSCVSSKNSYWLDDRLKERAFGSLEGKTYDRNKPKRDSIDGIEPMAILIGRLKIFLEDVLTKPAPFEESSFSKQSVSDWIDEVATRPASVEGAMASNATTSQQDLPVDSEHGRTIVVVAHGAAISALVGSLLLDSNLASMPVGIQRSRIWNCSITEVTVDISQLPLKSNRVHLQTLTQSESRSILTIERWADVRHLPDEIDNAVEGKGNVDEMVGKTAS